MIQYHEQNGGNGDTLRSSPDSLVESCTSFDGPLPINPFVTPILQLDRDFASHIAAYEEIDRVNIPVIASLELEDEVDWYPSSESSYCASLTSKCTSSFAPKMNATIMIGYKTVDSKPDSVLEDNWKDWTGARRIIFNLPTKFGLERVSFYRKIAPLG